MKGNRHQKIVELVENYEIETQEELAEKLNKAGFAVTQATISRDIRELKLTKIQRGAKQVYAALTENKYSNHNKYIDILKHSFVSMDMAQNILVIKTVAGMAMAVAAALDAIKFKEIVGSIAGDDTIMVAVRTTDESKVLMKKIEQLIEEIR
jgi:transcriptional regulator of arginine metabolism